MMVIGNILPEVAHVLFCTTCCSKYACLSTTLLSRPKMSEKPFDSTKDSLRRCAYVIVVIYSDLDFPKKNQNSRENYR